MKNGKTPFEYQAIGICGLSCQLCPRYYTDGTSRCQGCKSTERIAAGCPFITCAIKKKGVAFCWDCPDCQTCEKWKTHREIGKQYDSFISYQKLEDNIEFVQKNGIEAFQRLQGKRAELLQEMLKKYNDGRSKSKFCIAAAVMDIEELHQALKSTKENTTDFNQRLDEIAQEKGYHLKLRKKGNV